MNRWLDKEGAAGYCGCSRSHFERNIQPRVPPRDLHGKLVWDREDLDRYILRLPLKRAA